jgi:hypothetical protein
MKEHIKAEAIATRIRMMRLGGHAGAILLVEGDDDAKLFTEFVDKHCRIQIGHGKPKVETALTILNTEHFAGVLAIVDADFEFLDGKTPSTSNLIWTDLHDIEMMLIRSNALERVLREYGEPALVEKQDVRVQLLGAGEPIGYWRWLSSRNGLSLVFADLEFDAFIEHKTLQLDEYALRRAIEEKTKKPKHQLDSHETDITALRSHEPDSWHLCCGHDVVEILAIGLRRVFSKTPGDSTNKNKPYEIKGEQLEKLLRLAFHRSDFDCTLLAAAISTWETQSGFVVLKKAA